MKRIAIALAGAIVVVLAMVVPAAAAPVTPRTGDARPLTSTTTTGSDLRRRRTRA